MNKYAKQNIKPIEKYIMTFLVTLLIVILFCIAYMTAMYIIKNPEFTHYKDSENELLEYLIEKYKFLEKQNPTNYVISQKLGILYEAKNELKEAEREYKVKLREEVLKLRDEGMAIGIIDKTCYGIPTIAQLRFKRDCAKVVYDANQEAIMSIKLQMRIIENQLGREWSNEINNQ